jgi:hypothetical protein
MSQSARAEFGSRRAPRVSLLLSLLAMGACTSVLGIEDLHEGPRPGSGGDSNSAGESTSGNSSTAGKGNSGGSTGATGGAPDPTGGGAPDPSAGSGGEAGGGQGDGGSSGAGSGDPTVHGTVIDIWGNKLPNVPVQIGETLATTDANGRFTIENVSETYEASVDVEFVQYSTPRSFGWVYQGLTRRDPTLQVFWGQPIREGRSDFSPPGPTYEVDEKVSLAIGGPNGNDQGTIGEGGNDGFYVHWEGGDTYTGTAHALFLHYDHSTELPTKYYSHTSSPLTVNETDRTKAALTLTRDSLASENLQGTATWTAAADRALQVWLHFTDHTTLQVVEDNYAVTPFSYLVPTLAKSTFAVAASQGDPYYGETSITMRDGLSATSNPAFTMAPSVKLTSPASGKTMVTGATNFVISPNGNGGPYVFQFVNVDKNGPIQAIYLVTTQTSVTIPKVIGGGMELQANNLIEWRVGTHGAYADVDALASPGGGLMPFTDYGVDLEGPPRDGEFTMSEWRTFTTAP